MKKLLLIVVIVLFSVDYLSSQSYFPENGPLYIDTVVPRIDISINPDTLDWIYDHPDSDIEFHAIFVFNNGTIVDTINPVGFRLRGNTSRQSAKKSFKVSFNTFTSGGKYYGVEKLNLNGEHNDPSIMRSKVMWDILRKMEVPAPRANHVQLYINGNYHGLYINVEHIDEEFVLTRFGNNDGNLFKCLYPADLNYLGSDPNLYKNSGYTLKINEEADDFSDLANFINVINNASNNNLICQLDEVFNTYDYLKVAAADVLCGNWDGYIFNKNNFYLYHNTATDKMEFIPYDVDNTFGIDWFNIDWATRNIYNWQMGNEPRPLYTRLMDFTELRNQYSFYTNSMINTIIDIDSLIQSIGNRRDMIAPYVTDDPYYPLDYGYTYNDFLNSYTQTIGAHVKIGLFPYLTQRENATNAQLESNTMMPVINYIQHEREAGQQIWIKAFVQVDNHPATVKVRYSINDGTTQETDLQYIGNGIYSTTLTNITEESKVSYQISAKDIIGQEQILPCNMIDIHPATGDTPLLFINELMADNATTIADEDGNYSDWIEIYNGDSESVNLEDFYLTDNLDSPNKWQMPAITLEPGHFEFFWADGDPSLGDHHTNFKLSKDGEEAGIFSSDQIEVDAVIFGAQSEDISFGRFPDGTSSLQFFNTPTPGASNIPNGLEEFADRFQLIAYPNPATGSLVHLNQTASVQVFNSIGKHMYSGTQINSINISQYTPGLYILINENGGRFKLIVN